MTLTTGLKSYPQTVVYGQTHIKFEHMRKELCGLK
jgi:hypothetical protein